MPIRLKRVKGSNPDENLKQSIYFLINIDLGFYEFSSEQFFSDLVRAIGLEFFFYCRHTSIVDSCHCQCHSRCHCHSPLLSKSDRNPEPTRRAYSCPRTTFVPFGHKASVKQLYQQAHSHHPTPSPLHGTNLKPPE